MVLPLRWLSDPKPVSDEKLVADLDLILIQLRNRGWRHVPAAREHLEQLLSEHLSELERRIDQGRLFD